MRNKLQQAKRIVIKVGTSSLIYPNGNINLKAIDQLAFTLSDLSNQGKEIILVSSGAIGVGLNKLNLSVRPTTIPEQQAVAAVGQAELMNIYNQRFSTYSQQMAQVLLTRDVIEYPESRNNVTNTFEQLLKMNIIPIVNENDTVAISDNPTVNKEATLFSEINEINKDLFQLAGGKGSRFGTGGMSSKLKAAERVLANQQAMILANGKQPKIIFEILEGKDIGTLFIKGGHESD